MDEITIVCCVIFLLIHFAGGLDDLTLCKVGKLEVASILILIVYFHGTHTLLPPIFESIFQKTIHELVAVCIDYRTFSVAIGHREAQKTEECNCNYWRWYWFGPMVGT